MWLQIRTNYEALYFFPFVTLLFYHIYGQKFKTFENLPAYKAFAKETGVNEEKIIVLDKEAYNTLGEDIGRDGFFTYYGIVYKSRLISAENLENKSCWGQFRDLCKDINNYSSDAYIDDIPYLKNLTFDENKKTIIFLYSQQLGRRGVKNYIKPHLRGDGR